LYYNVFARIELSLTEKPIEMSDNHFEANNPIQDNIKKNYDIFKTY